MPAKTWKHAIVAVPLARVPDLLPDHVTDGSARLELRHESFAETGFWGDETRRFRATWIVGATSEQGYVELRPHSSRASEVVVHLAGPRSFPSRLTWNTMRLDRVALGLALELRNAIENTAEHPAEAERTA